MSEPPAGAAPRVSVIVVTARELPRLERCLAAVMREADAVALEIIVVLNAAEPALRAAFERDRPRVRAIVSEIPLGFAGGVNLGARHARGEFLHILHDDAEVCAGWLEPLIGALEARPRAGAVGSLIIGHDGEPQTAGHVIWRDGRTQPPWRHAPPPVEELRAVEIHDYCGSASLLVRRAAWDAAGGLDEEIHPAQWVDADLAMALHRCGYVVVCAPASHVRHERGGSSSARMKAFAGQRNRARFAAKWARDLADQEPYADDERALDRARAATLRRAEAILALEPPRDAGTTAPSPAPERDGDRLRRELAALARDVAFKDAYIASLESDATAAVAEIAKVHADWAELDRWAADRSAAAELYFGLHQEGHARELAAAPELAELRRRSQTLAAIEAGGWWRLRGRLLVLLRAAARARALAGRVGAAATGRARARAGR
jgi:GT2 family glycosyltransferase